MWKLRKLRNIEERFIEMSQNLGRFDNTIKWIKNHRKQRFLVWSSLFLKEQSISLTNIHIVTEGNFLVINICIDVLNLKGDSLITDKIFSLPWLFQFG